MQLDTTKIGSYANRFKYEVTLIWLMTSSLVWAFSFGIVKSYIGQVDPLVMGAIRAGIAAIFFLPFYITAWHQPGIRGRWDVFWKAATCGFFQIGLMYGPYLWSFKFLAAHQVAMMTMTTPLIMAVMMSCWRRSLHWRLVFAAMIATAGGMIAAWRQGAWSDVWMGTVLVQCSNVLFAGGLLLWKHWLSDYSKRSATVMFPFFAGAGLASLSSIMVMGGHVRSYTQLEWGVLLWLGVMASGLGFYMWNRGALQVSSGVLVVANNLKLPIAVVVSLVVFGEHANYVTLGIGMSLIFLAFKLGRV